MEGGYLYEWTYLMYDFDTDQERADYMDNAVYEHCMLGGVKVDHQDFGDTIYVSVPRWKPGVPSTLNTLVTDSVTGETVLRPFPSWEWNTIGDYTDGPVADGFDAEDRLWSVLGAVKLVVFDRDGSKVTDIEGHDPNRVFTDAEAPLSASFLNDLAIDTVNGVVYIADSGIPALEDEAQVNRGALLVYNYWTGDVYRLLDGSDYTTPDMDMALTIRGVTLYMLTGCDGIALTGDGEYLVFTALTSRQLNIVPTDAIWDKPGSVVPSRIVSVPMASAADGLHTDTAAGLYLTAIELDSILHLGDVGAVYRAMLTGATGGTPLTAMSLYTTLLTDHNSVWPDTISMAGRYMYHTTNNLDQYNADALDYSEGSVNYRIHRHYVGDLPYTLGSMYLDSHPAPPSKWEGVVWTVLKVVGVVAVGVLVFWIGLTIGVKGREAPYQRIEP
ncbi:major royal jelly protein/protein yellow [Kipferlia bialata]|uniref:Major royal jelly protein/protein yellow n=1 Tax=Kipferlia bialata TaxID=797122 RepID=A0A9K3GM89_9EUKA|nr:major royal jelly protein/protein yellow [Kipferlia bialata]|eukprot:g9385.t1